MRVVLDTNVLVAAFRSPRGASALLVEMALDARVTIIASPTLFLEYESVLTRPEHLAAAGVSENEAGAFLTDLADLIEPVGVMVSWRPQLQDADDEMVLEAAINGGARALITYEVQTFAAAAQRFGIEVLTPAAALLRLAS